MQLENLCEHGMNVYNLPGFQPQIIDEEYLQKLGVTVIPSAETLQSLRCGSEIFMKRMEQKNVIPVPELELTKVDINSKLEIHNYTGACPTLTYEINPVVGCNVGCLYCLVTDGVHENRLKAYTNYHLLVRRVLEEKYKEQHYYYFSPKTEALQEPSLQTGIAHKVLKEFIAHYEKHPDSRARLFIASKAGYRQLLYQYEGESILDLFVQLKDRMQFNTSVSIMPTEFRSVLEPYAATLDERMRAVRACQKRGIMANSALVQPIMTPYLTDKHIREFFGMLKENGIINYKPEFLTASMENLAMIGQLLGYFDKDLERRLYDDYIAQDNSDHRKQRGRTAPERALSIKNLEKMMKVTNEMELSISICYWVRQQLKIVESLIPIINRNGFQCLGYQSKLF